MDEKLGKVERIRQRAHQLWEREGRPDGQADRYWLEAERQVMSEDAKPDINPGLPEGLTKH